MSKAATPARTVHKGIEASGAWPVEYRFTHARGGNRHLMVVFSNIYAPDDYGWATGVLDGLRSNILWIRDRFAEQNTYYLCKDMDFSVEASVVNLIAGVTRALGLTPADVTLWGSSKGGSAALYYGLKYGFRNIVASVPQLRIGTFVRETYPDVGRHMLGEAMPDAAVAALDSLLPDLLASGVNPDANIYLVSSPQDEQYPAQVEPYLGLLRAYRNFNFLFSESPFITGHGKVTQRNTPPLLGIGYLLVEGIAPRLGTTRHGYEQPDADRSAIDAYLGSTSVLRGAEFPAPTVITPAAREHLPRDAVRFTGQAPGAVRVSVWEKGKFVGQAPVAQDGSWTWELGRVWSEGAHTLKIFSADASGFQSERTEVVFTAVDGGSAAGAGHGAATATGVAGQAGPVAAAVHTPAAYEQVMDTRVVFTGVAVGAAKVGFYEDGRMLGTASVGPDGGWTWEAGWDWAPGTYTVEAFALDAYGGQSPIGRTPFSVVGALTATTPAGGYYGGDY